ncbi:MAG TPA: YdeI/OmpD-associated family protein, partial [Steroidobacteraceae bacterium]
WRAARNGNRLTVSSPSPRCVAPFDAFAQGSARLRARTGMKQFKTRLTARGPGGAWTFLEVPFSVEEVFGSKARIAVAGTMNGFAFQNSLMPNGDGTHSMMVSKALQAGAKAAAGELVSVAMAVDRSERVVTIPPELKRALSTNKAAAAAFQALSYSHRKEFAEWIASAKREETRASRAVKSLAMVIAKKHVR